MRYLFGFLCVCALVASPLSVSAQDGDKERLEDFYPGTLPESPQVSDEDRLGDFHPEPAPEEPALQLKLDDAGVEVVPSGYVEMKLRQRASKARTWLIATGVVTAIGVPLLAVGLTYDRRQPPSEGFDLDFTGVALATVGGIMVFAGGFRNGRERWHVGREQAKAAQAGASALRDATQSPMGRCTIASRVLTTGEVRHAVLSWIHVRAGVGRGSAGWVYGHPDLRRAV